MPNFKVHIATYIATFLKCVEVFYTKEEKFDHLYVTNDYCELKEICSVASPKWQTAMHSYSAFESSSYVCIYT